MTNRPRPIPPTWSHNTVATLADPAGWVGVRGLHPPPFNKILDPPPCYLNKQTSNWTRFLSHFPLFPLLRIQVFILFYFTFVVCVKHVLWCLPRSKWALHNTCYGWWKKGLNLSWIWLKEILNCIYWSGATSDVPRKPTQDSVDTDFIVKWLPC